MQRVWYVAYGSNLSLQRFRCYLAGGTPAGGLRRYDGCRDRNDPARVVSLHAPGGLVFAGRSTVWGGGMAFYDARAAGRVACRGYLVTVEQFADVVAQEMRRAPGSPFSHVLAEALAEALAGTPADPRPAHAVGPGRYETLARIGMPDDVPAFTITGGSVENLQPAAPSSSYLRCIAVGLREAHGWDAGRIAGYLASCPGVDGAYTRQRLATIAGEVA
jgi:hypothetical protein